MSRKKKKTKPGKYKDIELNIMPFIDVFSLLTTFLLMAAVFVAIGIIEVQIPFLSTQKPDADPPRVLDIKVDMEKDKVFVITSWTKPPTNEEKKEFTVNEAGAKLLHEHLVNVRRQNPKADQVSFFTEDDVVWKDMVLILDAVKLRNSDDPVFPPADGSNSEAAIAEANQYLFPKVVLSSVML